MKAIGRGCGFDTHLQEDAVLVGGRLIDVGFGLLTRNFVKCRGLREERRKGLVGVG